MKTAFFRLLGCILVFFIFSANTYAQESFTKLVCEGRDTSLGLIFWYDVELGETKANYRFSSQQAGDDLSIGEFVLSEISDEKFIVQSPYSDLKARLALENRGWVLDLMEINGDFVIPTYDYFECVGL